MFSNDSHVKISNIKHIFQLIFRVQIYTIIEMIGLTILPSMKEVTLKNISIDKFRISPDNAL